MKRFFGVLVVFVVLLFGKAAYAYEHYYPGYGWLWEPLDWNYVSGDYVYAYDDASWMYVSRDSLDGPWTYSFSTFHWYNQIFGNWNYFLFNNSSSTSSDYYYYNFSYGDWNYMWVGDVWYYNLTYGNWGTIW